MGLQPKGLLGKELCHFVHGFAGLKVAHLVVGEVEVDHDSTGDNTGSHDAHRSR